MYVSEDVCESTYRTVGLSFNLILLLCGKYQRLDPLPSKCFASLKLLGCAVFHFRLVVVFGWQLKTVLIRGPGASKVKVNPRLPVALKPRETKHGFLKYKDKGAVKIILGGENGNNLKPPF